MSGAELYCCTLHHTCNATRCNSIHIQRVLRRALPVRHTTMMNLDACRGRAEGCFGLVIVLLKQVRDNVFWCMSAIDCRRVGTNMAGRERQSLIRPDSSGAGSTGHGSVIPPDPAGNSSKQQGSLLGTVPSSGKEEHLVVTLSSSSDESSCCTSRGEVGVVRRGLTTRRREVP